MNKDFVPEPTAGLFLVEEFDCGTVLGFCAPAEGSNAKPEPAPPAVLIAFRGCTQINSSELSDQTALRIVVHMDDVMELIHGLSHSYGSLDTIYDEGE